MKYNLKMYVDVSLKKNIVDYCNNIANIDKNHY